MWECGKPKRFSIISMPQSEGVKNLSVPGAVVFTLGIYYIINLGKKEDVVPFTKLAAGINWDLIIMFATIAPLVVGINAEQSNIMPTVVTALSGLLDGMTAFTFIVTFFFLAIDRKSTRLNSSHSRASRMPSSA